MAENLKLSLLSPEEIGNIYDKCLHLLSTKGVQIGHQEALKLLDEAGAQVDMGTQRAKFPVDMIEQALETAPRSFTLAGQIEEDDFVIPDPKGMFYTRPCTGAPTYALPGSYNHPDTNLEYVAEWGRLASGLDEINTATFLSPQDVPEETADVYGLRTVFEHTTRHIIVQPYGIGAVKYLFELALAVAGSKEALKKRPVMSILCCTLPPFVYDNLHTEVILQASRLGVPVYPNPLVNAGATSPITIPGTVLQSSAEVLGQLVMAQVFQPGTPVIAQPVYFTLDMSTGRILGSSFEACLGSAVAAQFIKEAFKIPVCTWGYNTDSYAVDGQAVQESLLKGLLVALSDCDLLIPAGQINCGIAASPVQLLIDNETIKILKRIKAGLKVDDDTLAWQEILDIEPGGHYLEMAHTLKHCREALRTTLPVTQPRDSWLADGGKDLNARMTERYLDLKKKLQPKGLSKELKRELDNIVKRADDELVRKTKTV